MKYKLFALNLRLFDEGGAAPSGASESGEVGSTPTAVKGEPKVIYGKQDAPVGQTLTAEGEETKAQTEEKPVVDRKAEFEKLIKGDYKDLFHERTQSIIDQRFKQSKQTEAQLQQVNSLLEIVSSKYNVDPTDVAGLTKAIQGDNEYWESAAEAMGMTVEQFMGYKRLEQENASFKRQQQEAMRQEQSNRTYNGWLQEAEQLKTEYPDFDLRAEIDNPKFLSLLQSNVGVKHAYEVAHLNDIKQTAAMTAAKQAEANVTNSIRANGQRPKEAGTRSQSGIIVKDDVSKLTPQDRKKIAEEISRGKKIKFD